MTDRSCPSRAKRVAAAVALASALTSCASVAHERGPVWLAVGASDPSPAAIARKAQRLEQSLDRTGLVFRLDDCGDDRRAAYGWSVDVFSTREAAEEAVAALRRTVPDAYAKRCTPVPGSLLDLRVAAVDPSLARLPPATVNWVDADMRTAVVPLGRAGAAIVAGWFDDVANDPLEGRRTRVSLAPPSGGAPVPLQHNCLDASGFRLHGDRLAFQCTIGQAADHLMHKVVVHALPTGAQQAEATNCRAPAFAATGTLGCLSETVDAQGRLHLAPRRVAP